MTPRTTRSERRAASFNHILDELLQLPEECELRDILKCEGINSVTELMSLHFDDIPSMKGTNSKDGNTVITISRGDMGRLRAVLLFGQWHQDVNGTSLRVTDWLDIDGEDFDNFRTSADYTAYNHNNGKFTPRPPSPKPTPKKRPVDEFRKGIKRDPKAFKTIKDQKYFNDWNDHTITQAKAQGVSEILNEDYFPFDEDEEELFQEKQKYMYAVFHDILQTDMGKTIVRKYKETGDARQIYLEYLDYGMKSTQALIAASETLTYLTTARLGTGQWNGTYEAFILHWLKQYEEWVKLQPQGSVMTDTFKRTLLENAVEPISDLRRVKDNSRLVAISGAGNEIPFDAYQTLLQSAAQTLDKSNTPSINAKTQRKRFPVVEKSKRQVYNMETHISDLMNFDESDDEGLDAVLEVNKASTNPQAKVPIDVWRSLKHEDRKAWDGLSDEGKYALLNCRNHGPSDTQTKDTRQVHRSEGMYDVEDTGEEDGEIAEAIPDDLEGIPDTSTTLLANVTKRSDMHPGDLRKVMSKSLNKPSAMKREVHEVTIDGKVYRAVNMTRVEYEVSERTRHSKSPGSLMDRGANGGVAGDDVRVISTNDDGRIVDVSGLDNHRVRDMKLVTVGGVVHTQRGPAILVMHQYAGLGRGRSIHAPGQWEHFGNLVHDKSKSVGGEQLIKTLDGYYIPLDYENGLPRVKMKPFTDTEWEELPHVVVTSDMPWDPSVLDLNQTEDDEWYDALPDLPDGEHHPNFTPTGEYKHRTVTTSETNQVSHQDLAEFMDAQDGEDLLEDAVERIVLANIHEHQIEEHDVTVRERDWSTLQPLFAWASVDRIKETFNRTTQFARIPAGRLKKRFKSPFPAANVRRRSEAVATDTVFSDTPAFATGQTCAQIFVGTETLYTDVYGMKTDKEFVNTLEDNIRKRGAMDKLISDRAQAQISNRVKDILRNLVIDDWQSQPHHQHQNKCERHYQTIKAMTNKVMDRKGIPAAAWLLCLAWICGVYNILSNPALAGNLPFEALTNERADISPWLCFSFWDKVYYRAEDPSSYSESPEDLGYFVGVSEDVGNAMTFKILTPDFKDILHRSDVRLADGSNRRAELAWDLEHSDGEVPCLVRSKFDDLPKDEDGNHHRMVRFETALEQEDLVGRTFLKKHEESGNVMRMRIVEAIRDAEGKLASEPEHRKFRVQHDESGWDEIMSYQEMMDHLDDKGDKVWKFKEIVGHQGPLAPKDRNYKGSRYNVRIAWENGEVTYEPLDIIAKDDPVTCAIYAEKANLLDELGWRRFRRIAKRQKKLLRQVNQAKLRSYRAAPRYKYGYEVPRNYDDALRIDAKNGNAKWQDAVKLEFEQLDSYGTFDDKGFKGKPPEGHKRVRLHIVFDVKHDGRHKARVVANGNLTEVPLESVYSGVVSLRGLRMMLFLAELNGYETWSTDIGNAYLEAFTKEKLYVVAGPEFGDREGHILVIVKALYGLRSSGKRWAERMADCLHTMGFRPCKAEPSIWMRRVHDKYEYIAVYVDDLAIASANPREIIDVLTNVYKFVLKGTGTIAFHLGCDFKRDEDGVLCMQPRRYIEKMLGAYEQTFGETASNKKIRSPLPPGDHPELDESEFLDEDGIQKYQSLVGSFQWAVSLGRWDIMTAVMTLSSFRPAPRQGHLDRAKRLCCYLSNFKDASIRFRTDEPDYSMLPEQCADWDTRIYGEVREDVPEDAPEPLGRYVTITSYFDANLHHCMLTGRAVTGILHLLNQTPIDAYSKKQSTVETSTYGAEFLSGRTCVEQGMDLRITLRYLGVRLREANYMFGDNKSMVDSSTIPDSRLHKRHVALSWHRVREAIASSVYRLYHIDGKLNPADILSKHWSYMAIYRLLRPLLFYSGDTADIED